MIPLKFLWFDFSFIVLKKGFKKSSEKFLLKKEIQDEIHIRLKNDVI
jgi:hypothetical protein